MKKSKRKIHVIFIMLLLVALFSLVYYFYHPTYYKYNDIWIVGSTISDIQEKYGEFDLTTDSYVAYYIYTDNKGFLPDHLKHYYYMYYDNNGIVYQVVDSCQPDG